MEYAAVDAGGMMFGQWFPPHVPCFTAHLFYAVRAQHAGIVGFGGLFPFCSILLLARSVLKEDIVCHVLYIDYVLFLLIFTEDHVLDKFMLVLNK